jgi:hypothetical protein
MLRPRTKDGTSRDGAMQSLVDIAQVFVIIFLLGGIVVSIIWRIGIDNQSDRAVPRQMRLFLQLGPDLGLKIVRHFD